MDWWRHAAKQRVQLVRQHHALDVLARLLLGRQQQAALFVGQALDVKYLFIALVNLLQDRQQCGQFPWACNFTYVGSVNSVSASSISLKI